MQDTYGPVTDIVTRYQTFQDSLAGMSVYELLDMYAEVIQNDPSGMRFAEIALIRERIATKNIV